MICMLLLLAPPGIDLCELIADDHPGNLSARSQIVPFINWLPAESETLAVTRVGCKVSQARQADHEHFDFAHEMIRSTLRDVMGQTETDILARHSVRTWIEAGCCFKIPDVPIFERLNGSVCSIIVFEEPVSDDIRMIMQQKLSTKQATRLDIDEHEIFTFIPLHNRGKQLDPLPQFWLAVPRRDVLILVNDEGYLRSILHRITNTNQADMAFPPTLEEWKHINKFATTWGMRRFVSTPRETDFSDARNNNGATASSAGFAFEIDNNIGRCNTTWFACDTMMHERLRSRVWACDECVTLAASDRTDKTIDVHIQVDWSRFARSPEASTYRHLKSSLRTWLSWNLGHAFAVMPSRMRR